MAYIRKSKSKPSEWRCDFSRIRVAEDGTVRARYGERWQMLTIEASRYILRRLYDHGKRAVSERFESELIADVALEKLCKRKRCRQSIAQTRLLNALRVGQPAIYCSHICQMREAQRTFAARRRATSLDH